MIEDVKKFVANLAVYYKEDNKEVLRITLDWVNKQNLSNENLNKLFNMIIQGEKFFPRIIDIKKYFQTPGEIDGIRAYSIAFKTARNHGVSRSAYFANNRIAQTIRLGWGSWEAWGMDLQPDNFRQKQFIEIYNTTEFIKDQPAGLLRGIYEDDGIRLVKDGGSDNMIENAELFLKDNLKLENKELKQIGNSNE